MTHISRDELKDIELRIASENIKEFIEREGTMRRYEHLDYGVDKHEVQFVMETRDGLGEVFTYDFIRNTGTIGRHLPQILSKRQIKVIERELVRISKVIFQDYTQGKWIREIKTEEGIDNGRDIW